MKGPALPYRCAIVLAGGEGRRLRPFLRQLNRDDLPKQYVSFIGTRSLLEHTLDRAEKLLPPQRIFTVVNRYHLNFSEVGRQLCSRPAGTVIVQPENRETGPGILLPLMHLYKHYPKSTVAVFPSDHFIGAESVFLTHVAAAFHAVEEDPSRLVLLGVEAEGPDPGYGYIVPAGDAADADIGGLWNTMVMVFNADNFLDLLRRVAPGLQRCFEKLGNAIGKPHEQRVVEDTYRHIKPQNFSTGVLEALARRRPSCLSVLPISGALWSDWGVGDHVLSVLKQTGYLNRLNGVSENKLLSIWGGV
ncbi:MAG: NTP transferase domain-containing protein [Deltaproteobacteria bacterium]|nr:NTP transferase domain-containing protein [Deltaproteobacteria bacterium]